MLRLFRLAVLSAVSTYALIVLGGITRVTGSGLGCEDDWPLCQGKPYPPLNTLAIIEYLHRTVAAYIGVLVIAVMIGAWRARDLRTRTKATAAAAFVLVIAQGLLGAVTVWWELPPEIVTAHLGAALLFFGTTLLTAYFIALDRGAPAWLARLEPLPNEERSFIWLARAATLLIFVLILSGGATSTTGAALACWEWPACGNGRLIPHRTGYYTWINLSHRAIALIGLAVAVAVLIAAFRRPATRAVRRLAFGAAIIISGQILLGGAYVLTRGNAWLSAAHLGTAALLWACMLAIALLARTPTEGARKQASAQLASRAPASTADAFLR